MPKSLPPPVYASAAVNAPVVRSAEIEARA